MDLYLMQHGQATSEAENPQATAQRRCGESRPGLGPRACASATACTAESSARSKPRNC